MGHKFFFKDTSIKNVRKYKYLGFLVTPSEEIRSGLEDLRIRALKALMKIKAALGPLFRKNITNTIHLYNHMVKPILLYASDFWGCLKLPKNNPIERLHNMFCKQLLGLQKQTNTMGILLELGMVPITYHALKADIKNWDCVRNKKSNNLLDESLNNASKENLTRISSIKTLLESNGMLQSFLTANSNPNNNSKQKDIENLKFQRLCDQFHQNALASFRNENSKLKTYSTLKNDIGMEKYLIDKPNFKYRSALTKLRLSNYPLLIEIGRHSRMERPLRFCPFCPTMIEDELHFLIQCPTYKEMIDKHFPPTVLHNTEISDKEKFHYMLKQEDLFMTAKFIFDAFEYRKVTLEVSNIIHSIISIVEENEITLDYKQKPKKNSIRIVKEK